MDWHEYVSGQLVHARLAELRASAERARLIDNHRSAWRDLHAAVGRALMRLRFRVVDVEPRSSTVRETNTVEGASLNSSR